MDEFTVELAKKLNRLVAAASLLHSKGFVWSEGHQAWVEPKNPVKAKETGIAWQHAAAKAIYEHAVQLGLSTDYDGVICTFEDIICSREPFRQMPNQDWIEAAVKEMFDCSLIIPRLAPSITAIIRKHTPRP